MAEPHRVQKTPLSHLNVLRTRFRAPIYLFAQSTPARTANLLAHLHPFTVFALIHFYPYSICFSAPFCALARHLAYHHSIDDKNLLAAVQGHADSPVTDYGGYHRDEMSSVILY